MLAVDQKEELFRQADILTIHLVLSSRTRGLVSAKELALMKPTARLVNTSRGPIVVEADLIAVLQSGKIAGAALDVFDKEPLPPDHPLRGLPNLLATPHIGYVSRDLYQRFYQDGSIARASVDRLSTGLVTTDDMMVERRDVEFEVEGGDATGMHSCRTWVDCGATGDPGG